MNEEVSGTQSGDSSTAPPPRTVPAGSGGRGALLVGIGILASRLFGLVREAVFAAYVGNTATAAAFKAALRVPNFLQNLLGEGVLSASFIPVYAQLLGAQKKEDAQRVAGAVFAILSLATAVLVLLGILATPWLVTFVAPGFEGETLELTVSLVRILFPMTGLLVLSAWCLGVLNSHRRFLLSYAAPVIWNGAMIAALIAFRGAEKSAIVEYVAWAAVLGAGLQFAIQLPTALKLLGALRLNLGSGDPHTKQVLKSFGPVVVTRGVVQISAYVDLMIGSAISAVAFSTLDYAQRIYLIPVSLFGMAISAAELPEMSRATGEAGDAREKIRTRLEKGLERVAFFVIPSAAAFLCLGDVIAAALLQRGAFTAADSRLTWYVLIGACVGLLATTQSRLISSTFYALKDTRTPFKISVVRVVFAAVVAYVAGVHGPGWLGLPREVGVIALPLASGIAAWLEFSALKHFLRRRVPVPSIGGRLGLLWGAALASALLALSVKLLLIRVFGADATVVSVWGGTVLPQPAVHPLLSAAAIVVPFGVAYFGLTYAAGVEQAEAVLGKVLRRLKR